MFRKRLNKDGDANNTLKIAQSDSGCCADALTTCKYRVVVDPFVDLVSITVEIDGANTVVPFAAQVDDLADLPAAITAALESVGYFTDDEPKNAPKNVVITTDGTERTIDIWGEAIIIALTSSAPVVDSASQMCESYVRCMYTVEVPVGVVSITVDGGTAEDLNDGDPYTTGQGATLKTDIEGSTYLENAEQVTVTEDTEADTFTITFYFERAEVEFNTTMATRSNCRPDFR